jgi:DNA-binding NtrC family response regulator
VDDDEDLVKSLSELLCDEGFKVSSTADGMEALALIRTVAPAVVLLDVWLPGMDGVETLQALQAMHADVEVIVMSGHGNIATAVHMTKLGAFDYLEKPLSLYRVLSVIERALEHRERRHNAALQDTASSRGMVIPSDFQLTPTYRRKQPPLFRHLPIIGGGTRRPGRLADPSGNARCAAVLSSMAKDYNLVSRRV